MHALLFFGVFFFSIRLLEQILLHMDRDQPCYFFRPTFFIFLVRQWVGRVVFAFLRRRASSSSSVLPWRVVGRYLKERRHERKENRKDTTRFRCRRKILMCCCRCDPVSMRSEARYCNSVCDLFFKKTKSKMDR